MPQRIEVQAQFCPLGAANCTGSGPLVMTRLAVRLMGNLGRFVYTVNGLLSNETALRSTNLQGMNQPSDANSILNIEPLGTNIT